ncbi:nucleotidyl transferase AbiEii/AbiGii toxin family protein [Candidatus Peregrinibacteria bacterium]|nr:nucleotidyl transferase AbiEii/AbiGii toxin family protein [Candidatus Peregrinibacteria bacterium]
MNILIEKLKNLVSERLQEGIRDVVVINMIKEELQYPVLDFIYKNREYSHLTMYGGTLLRILYGLPRMSEDLDFQTVKKFNFEKFKKDLTHHFKTTYEIDINVVPKTARLTKTEFAFINFPDILGKIGLHGHARPTVLKLHFDVNYLAAAENLATEVITKVKDNYVFSIKTYPISTLMASKIAAFLLRTKRGIGDKVADCKPRDVYDLMWYMGQKIVPNVDYLRAVHARVGDNKEFQTVIEVFEHIEKRVRRLEDDVFEADLKPFFYNPGQYDDWHNNWRQRFIELRKSYEIYKIKENDGKVDLVEIFIGKNFSSGNRYFHFWFSTEEPENGAIKFTCVLSEYWYMFSDLKISSDYRAKSIESLIKSPEKLTDLDYSYVGLFYRKIEDFLERNNYIVMQKEFKTKLIRSTADQLNVKTQVFLDRRLLIKEKFEDLL